MELLNLISKVIFMGGVLFTISFAVLIIFSDLSNTKDNVELLLQIRVYVIGISCMVIGLGGYLITKST